VISKEVWAIMMDTTPPSRDFIFQPVEYDTHIGIRLFRDNVSLFSEEIQEDITLWVAGVINKIRALGVPCYIEVFDKPKGKAL